MGAHKSRRGWRRWLATVAVAVLFTAEILLGLIFLAVLIDILRTM